MSPCYKTLTVVVHTCCPQIQTLEAQNRILRKNISCLFKTAKAEVQRKDAILQEQRDKCVNFVRVLCVWTGTNVCISPWCRIAKLEASMAAETRESGYLGDKVMMMQSASATEQEMLQLWLLHCQQQQLYSGDYTGFCTPGVGQEVYYGTYPNGYYETLSSQKRSAVEECEQSGRRPFRESQTATVAVDKRALSKKHHHHKDRHTSGSKRRSEHRY